MRSLLTKSLLHLSESKRRFLTKNVLVSNPIILLFAATWIAFGTGIVFVRIRVSFAVFVQFTRLNLYTVYFAELFIEQRQHCIRMAEVLSCKNVIKLKFLKLFILHVVGENHKNLQVCFMVIAISYCNYRYQTRYKWSVSMNIEFLFSPS